MSTTHRAESEPPPRRSDGRASRRRERGGTTEPTPGAPARVRRQRRRERRATATVPTGEATAIATTRREREHYAEKANRRLGRAAAERHTAAKRQHDPAGARSAANLVAVGFVTTGIGAPERLVIGIGSRLASEFLRHPPCSPALSALRERAAAAEERWPSAMPPRMWRHT